MAIDQDVIDMFQPLIGAINVKLSGITTNIIALNDSISSLKLRIVALEDAQGSPIDITDLENRVASIESAIETIVHPDEIVEVYQPEGQDEIRVTYKKVS